jgi:hypothetical protein
MSGFARLSGVFVLAVLLPGTLYAQASIAGVVRDSSGAVLPGVTVEASSPALIEKVRTVVTDGAGQYRIIDLRPGTYAVTFTLPGFNTVRREGVELSGDAVANVAAEMRVGALEETITVTGAAPVVDVQGVRQQQVLGREIVRDLPTSRSYYTLVALIPGMVIDNRDVGGTSLDQTGDFTIHGGKAGDGRMAVDGISVAQRTGVGGDGANRSMFSMNAGLMQETVISTSGGLGEAETSGVLINMVPREGGNTIRGSLFGTFGNGATQGSNFDDELRATVRTPNDVKAVWETSAQVGGPLLADRLWYVASAKHAGTRNWIAGMFHNLNAGDITKWTYEPDLSRRAFDDTTLKSVAVRLTWQASAKNKFNMFWDEQQRHSNYLGGGAATTSPESSTLGMSDPSRAFSATWSSPQTNRLLLEAGMGGTWLQWGAKPRPGYDRRMIRVQEQAGLIPGLNYRGMTWDSNELSPYQIRASASYVTGSHSAKVGMTHTWNSYDDESNNPNPIQFRLNNGVPNQLTLTDSPRDRNAHVNSLGVYAQDSWVLGRLTLQGGLRFDGHRSYFLPQSAGFTPYVPNGFSIPHTEGSKIRDITPRMAAAYDLRGDGRTAIKMTLGKYVAAQEIGTFGEQLNPTVRLATTTNRSWNDANRNFVPDCDLLNPVANGECGAYSNSNFGRNVYSETFDPEMLTGWGQRQYNWEFSTTVQREIIPRVGVTVGAFRRWYGNFIVTDNRATAASDYNTFSVTAPSDPRLPGGGGYVLSGLYDVVPTKFGQTDNFITSVKTFGGGQKEFWTGYDANITVRGVGGATLSGGISTGRTTRDSCELKRQLPEHGGVADPWCERNETFRSSYKALGSYVIPRIEVLISGTFQSIPGSSLAANFNVPNAQIIPSLGRPLSGGAANVQVNLVEPGTFFGDRVNQVDIRFAKVLTFGRTRANVGVDLYNALNTNVATAYNQTYGANWLTPQAIMPARFIKFNAQFDW